LPLTRSLRVLLWFVCVLVLVDTMFFTALTPLRPHYWRACRSACWMCSRRCGWRTWGSRPWSTLGAVRIRPERD
jgi:hypothetical protein